MEKEFIPYDTIRNDGFRLARRIWDDGFIPNVMYISLRGGSYLGNVMHEWFKLVDKETQILYAAVVAHSYSDINQQTKMMIDGWTYSPEHLRSGDKILLIDDIFDSGATMNYLVSAFLNKGIPRSDIKIAVYDYKVFHNRESAEPIQPDYWCRKHDIYSDSDSRWIHYMSHELLGLTPAELEKYYFSAYPELRETFQGIIS
ncbi:MAG: phosphoribosyltransferase [Treponema sp.]